MRNEWLGVPEILKKKLMANAGIMLCILVMGIFMERQESGEGFFKLTAICILGWSIYLGYLALVIVKRSYKVLEGEVTGIRFCTIRRKYWEVELTGEDQEVETFIIPAKSGIRKGSHYRVFVKDGTVWAVELITYCI